MVLVVDPDLPVNDEDHGQFVVWNLREWDGDLDEFKEINDAWVTKHQPPEKVGTISVFPDHVVVGDELQDFISEGWNEACEITDLEYLAIVVDGIGKLTVKNRIDVPSVKVETFDTVDAAVEWMEEQVI